MELLPPLESFANWLHQDGGEIERGERNNAALAALILLLTIFPCQRDKIALGGPLKFILASGRVLSETENFSESEAGKTLQKSRPGFSVENSAAAFSSRFFE